MILHRTESLCPKCLRKISAVYVQEGETVFLRKTCPDHGTYQVPVWQTDILDFKTWSRPKIPSYPEEPGTMVREGCPFDCGLCPAHTQHTCTGLVEVTMACNLSCPICYADAGSGVEPDLADLHKRFATLRKKAGACNLQISGGEPTVRDDLPQILDLAKEHSFGLLQLNTNGLRLGEEAGYAKLLANHGLESVYLQWDGVSEETFLALRGRKCLDFKQRALKACAAAGLGVVLVATVVRGINDRELGDLLRFAVKQGDVVRGLHLQPAAFFGRYPWKLAEAPRLTLPGLLNALVQGAPELVRFEDVHPPGCEHELCSFSALYARTENGLRSLSQAASCCAKPSLAQEGARVSKQFTALHWKGVKKEKDLGAAAFDRFLAQASLGRRFTLSAMAFQDALSLDVERVRGCCIHVVRVDGRMVPFCLHNLTSEDGIRLYKP